MSIRSDQLLALRQHEQESKGYATSSRWYTYLSYAINHLDLAETAADATDQFRNGWFAIYNLYMMNHQAGEIENLTLSNWVASVNDNPQISQLALETPPALLQALQKANKDLLVDAERQKPRDAATLVESWLAKQSKNQSLSPQKACSYLFTIGRDLRNALSHPTFNSSKRNNQSALQLAADHFLRVAEAAIRTTIEHPLPGSTGRVTAYRFFLYPYLKNSDSFLSDYYLERILPDAELTVFTDDTIKTTVKALAQAQQAARETLLRDQSGDITRQQWCEQVLFPVLEMNATTGTTIVGAKGVYSPDYVVATSGDRPTSNYQGKAAGNALQCLLWVLPWREPLDNKAIDGDFIGLTMTEMAHQALAESDVPWAILTNGQQLRLLHKANAHKPRSFLEADLASMLNNPNDQTARQAFRYLLGFFSHSSFVDVDSQDQTRLDRILAESERHGKEIGEELKENVFKALEELGEGFLYRMRQEPDSVTAWQQHTDNSLPVADYLASNELLQTIYEESLALLYRLLFLFYAESRDLLPMDKELYRDTYSLEAVRDDIISIHDDPDPRRFFSQGTTELYDRLNELFHLVDEGFGNLIPAYNGGLFDPEKHPFLAHFTVGDYYMARAIDLLSRTRPRRGQVRGEGRKKVTYRDLDVRHLGSIYEGLLEYSAHIATEEQIVFERSKSGSKYEEYVTASELSASERKQLTDYRQALAENDELPNLPNSCKVRGIKETGQYFLVFGGKDSKRKSSGSYYTPDYIVQYIVENTLGPLVRGENREGDQKDLPLTAAEILELKVLDPAMGSGHFLVAATEYLARAYGQALIREGQDRDGVMDDEEFIRYKRLVAERCIYGVDINTMAVELAKLSLWLFTMDPQRPLSFLDHHLKKGDSVLGVRLSEFAEPIKNMRSRNSVQSLPRMIQSNAFSQQFMSRIPIIMRDILGILRRETNDPSDIKLKKDYIEAIEYIKKPFRVIADMNLNQQLGQVEKDYDLFLSNVDLARNYVPQRRKLLTNYFHWEIEFPEVYFDEYGNYLERVGFDCILRCISN